MMQHDRIEFANSIDFGDQSDYIPGIIKFFDETMGLYNIVGNCNCNVVNATPGDKVVLYTVEMGSAEDAKSLESVILQQPVIQIYGRVFNVHCTRSQDNNVISIVLRTDASLQ